MGRLDDKVAIITGGARGQGAEEVRLFVQEGGKVIIADVLDEEGERLEAELCESGGEAAFVHLDVTDGESWNAAVSKTVSLFGKIDILVNNAGIYKPGTVEQTTEEDWDVMLDVNAKGVFLGTKSVIPFMREAGGGSIINISSVAGLVGAVMTAAYSSSKGAVRLLTKSTALQYAAENIRCNSVHPGMIQTDMLDRVFEGREARGFQNAEYVSSVPLGRIGTPREIANGVLFLASDDSSYMTGSELVIDGGITSG